MKLKTYLNHVGKTARDYVPMWAEVPRGIATAVALIGLCVSVALLTGLAPIAIPVIAYSRARAWERVAKQRANWRPTIVPVTQDIFRE